MFPVSYTHLDVYKRQLQSNKAIAQALRTGLSRAGLPEDSLQLIEDTSRETTRELMRLNRYIDVLIPRCV